MMVAAVCHLDTAPLPAPSVNSPANRLVPTSTTLLSPLYSTLVDTPATAHSKRLTRNLSPLESALTKNRGEGSTSPVTPRLPRASRGQSQPSSSSPAPPPSVIPNPPSLG